jgi:cytochrome c5
MSQDHHSQDEGPIKTPKQLVVTILLAFVLPILLIVLLVNYVTSDAKDSVGSSLMTPEAVTERIKPVATFDVNESAGVPGSASGQVVYEAACLACHGSGALGSPKFGDAAAWGPRIGQGLEALWKSAMEGKNAMPAQGKGEYTADEIKRAVVYMANEGGASFTPPPVEATAPETAASAP